MSLSGMMSNLSSQESPLPWGVDLSDNFPLKYTISIFLLLFCSLWALSTQRSKSRLIPGVYIVGGQSEIKATSQRFRDESKTLIHDGYSHTDGKEPFYVPSNLGPRLIIPTRYMEELKSAPIQQVDFIGTVHEMFEYQYTGVVHPSRMVPSTLVSHLTPRLPSIMPEVQDEMKIAISEEFPPCDDWTEVNIMEVMTRVITRATSRMAGGKTLSQDREWITAAISYAVWAFTAAQKIKKVPTPLRRLVGPLLSEVRKEIPWSFSVAARAAVPLLEHRKETGEQANDFLQFLKDTAKGDEKENKFISHLLVMVAFASIHTSVATIGSLIFDLCQYPQLVEMIRGEYEGIVDQNGNIPKGGFAKLVKMDSIMKESQRLNPITLLTFERIIHQERTLKDGFTIPAGTQIGVPNYEIAMDPRIYPNPEEFDPLRFEKLRQDPAWANKSQFVSSNPDSMSFGYGRHACPGRQFMDQEFKSFLVKLLSTFDLKFKDGQSRVPNSPLESQYLLHHVSILLKRRKL
ncbi:cytochrome P450 monooxygenase [Xylaria bambusicola]|uniref:cytochrome P450 monooxygenase n=1 Tax=Xylaria bambusicola TaxID=326684 RepID=UPI002008B60A|nr:cytochrome P450 monooxygenase [Xylaria bambusicola]KAI0514717.1 cytochrome P450 monooxygenase [Xylaria bambusicola]